MIQGEHRLAGNSHLGRADGREFLHYRAGVVVGHHVGGPDGDEVAAADHLAQVKTYRKALGDFFY